MRHAIKPQQQVKQAVQADYQNSGKCYQRINRSSANLVHAAIYWLHEPLMRANPPVPNNGKARIERVSGEIMQERWLYLHRLFFVRARRNAYAKPVHANLRGRGVSRNAPTQESASITSVTAYKNGGTTEVPPMFHVKHWAVEFWVSRTWRVQGTRVWISAELFVRCGSVGQRRWFMQCLVREKGQVSAPCLK